MSTLPGLNWAENEMGFTAVRLHYSADPEKGDEWFERARRMYPDPTQWMQEFEVNWFSSKGARVYPEFSETVHVRPLEARERKIIYRAWDFGWHAPVCVLAQIDQQDRLCVLKEIVGREETTKEFALKVIQRCTAWWPMHNAGYQDFCDPAGDHHVSTASEKSEARDVDVLQSLAIWPKWEHGWSRKHSRGMIHQLLAIRLNAQKVPQGPGMYVDAAGCPVLLQGFLGKYVYAPKKNGQVHDEPDENLHPWADAQAALRYLAMGLYNALGLRKGQAPPVPAKVDYSGYGTPISRSRRRSA